MQIPVKWQNLPLKYTTPAMIFRQERITDTLRLLVIGGDGEGSYEWVIERNGLVDRHSDIGYGSPEVALRDVLIEYLGPPENREAM